MSSPNGYPNDENATSESPGAGEAAASAADDAEQQTTEPPCAMDEAREALLEVAEAWLGRANRMARGLTGKIETRIRAQPGRALIIAASVGLLAGLYVARRSGGARTERDRQDADQPERR